MVFYVHPLAHPLSIPTLRLLKTSDLLSAWYGGNLTGLSLSAGLKSPPWGFAGSHAGYLFKEILFVFIWSVHFK